MEEFVKDKTTQELTELALAEINRLCQGGNWRMCVPVQWNDSDILLTATIKRLDEENATLKKLLQFSEEIVGRYNKECEKWLI